MILESYIRLYTCIHIIPVLRRQCQEDEEFKTSRGYIVRYLCHKIKQIILALTLNYSSL